MQHVFLHQSLSKINWISECLNFLGLLEQKLSRYHSNIPLKNNVNGLKQCFSGSKELKIYLICNSFWKRYHVCGDLQKELLNEIILSSWENFWSTSLFKWATFKVLELEPTVIITSTLVRNDLSWAPYHHHKKTIVSYLQDSEEMINSPWDLELWIFSPKTKWH